MAATIAWETKPAMRSAAYRDAPSFMAVPPCNRRIIIPYPGHADVEGVPQPSVPLKTAMSPKVATPDVRAPFRTWPLAFLGDHKHAVNPSPGRRGVGVRCSDRKRWRQPDRAVSAHGAGPAAYTSPCPLLTGEGSPRLFWQSSLYPCRNGLVRRSSPSVLAGPWPGRNWTSSPSGSSLPLMPPIRSLWLP